MSDAEHATVVPIARDTKQARAASEYAAITSLNYRFAVVNVGGKRRIMEIGRDEDGFRTLDFLTADDFRLEIANERSAYGQRLADAWIASPLRRQYDGITFAPGEGEELRRGERRDRGGEPGTWFNRWNGFAVEPAPGCCERFKAHLLDNVCQGDTSLYLWLWAWMAQAVQQPAKPQGTAVVLRGLPGTGKSIVGEIFGKLFGRSHVKVDTPEHVAGKHNEHLEDCLFLQIDDAILTEERGVIVRLKNLVTGSTISVEPKGLPRRQVKNCMRVMICSDHDWAVPIHQYERRFAVFDVSDQRRGNDAYFAAIVEETENGGLAALMEELLMFDCSTVNLRKPPATTGLLDQKLHSLRIEQRWWYERLWFGTQLRGGEWSRVVPCGALYDDFVEYAKRRGMPGKIDEVEFGGMLRKLCPKIGRARRRGVGMVRDRRGYVYVFESLGNARGAFEAAIGHQIAWSAPDLSGEGDHSQPQRSC